MLGEVQGGYYGGSKEKERWLVRENEWKEYVQNCEGGEKVSGYNVRPSQGV